MALLPLEALPDQTQRLIAAGRPESVPGKSLGLLLRSMDGIERVTHRTNAGVLWRVKP